MRKSMRCRTVIQRMLAFGMRRKIKQGSDKQYKATSVTASYFLFVK